jgi:hypothetical protein
MEVALIRSTRVVWGSSTALLLFAAGLSFVVGGGAGASSGASFL